MRVLVTGGTGVLGRGVVTRLRERGIEARVLTRGPGTATGEVHGDLETGEGLAQAVAGVDVIAHCASGGSWRHPQRDLVQTRNLLAALGEARPHLVYISIVGVDRIRLGLFRAKLACERMIEASGLPWTVLRTTQFHDLVLMFAMVAAKPPVAVVPRGFRFQAVEVGEAADRMVELILGPPAGRARDLGGPRVEEFATATRAYLAATGRRKPVLRIPLPGRISADYRAGANLLGPDGERGSGTFAEYLQAHAEPDGELPAPYDLRRVARR